LQSAVIDGSLHCSSDEAIGLAGIQFRIEKVSEQRDRTPDSLAANSPDSLLDIGGGGGGGVGGPCGVLQPISEDKEHHLQLEVPAVTGTTTSTTPSQRPDILFNADVVAAAAAATATTVTSPTVTDDEQQSTSAKIDNVLFRPCSCFRRHSRRRRKTVPERDPFGIVHKVHLYVPPDYREPKITAKLIKVLYRRRYYY